MTAYPVSPSTVAVISTPSVTERTTSRLRPNPDSALSLFAGSSFRPRSRWKLRMEYQVAGFDTQTAAAAIGMFARQSTASIAATSIWMGTGGNMATASPIPSPSDIACASGCQRLRWNTRDASQKRIPLFSRYFGRRNVRYVRRTNLFQNPFTMIFRPCAPSPDSASQSHLANYDRDRSPGKP